MPKIGELFIDISANNSKLRANLAEASSLIRDWSLLVTGLTAGITNAFRTIVDVGIKGVTIAATAMVVTFTLAAKSGADFEDAMVRTFTILKESSESVTASFTTLTEKARTLGRDTLFSATQAAQGMQILAKSGFDAREILDSIAPVLNLAIVGNLGLGEAANFAVSALRGFNLETSQAGRVSDVLALASSKANTTISELGSALSFVAPVAAGAGISLEETVAALGLLANAGIKASRAGTTLRRALSVLLAPTGRAKKIMSELSLTFINSAGNVKPLTQVIKELNAAGVTTAQTMQIFGLRAGPGMIALMKGGAGAIASFTDKLESADGAANRMAQNFRTTIIGRTRDLMASIVDLGLAFSEEFKKPLADTIFAIRNFLVTIVNTGNRMGIFKAIIKGIGTVLEPVKEIIIDLSKRFLQFFSNLTPQKVLGFFESLKSKVEEFLETLTSGELKETIEEVLGILVTLGTAAADTIKVFGSLWSKIPDQIRPTITAIGLVLVAITALFGGFLNIVIFLISMNALTTALGAKVTFLAALWTGILTTIKAISLFLLRVLLPVIIAIATFLAFLTIGNLLAEMETWGALLDSIIARWDRLVEGIKEAVARAKLFTKASDENADAVLSAVDARAGAQKRVEEADRKLADAAKRDIKRQNEFLADPLGGVKKATQDTIKDTAGIFGKELTGIMGTIAGVAGNQAEPLSRVGKQQNVVANFDGIKIDLSGTSDEITGALSELLGTLGENNEQVIRIIGNTVSGIEMLSTQVESNTNQLNSMQRRAAGLNRQAVKPDEDRQNKSALGASIE